MLWYSQAGTPEVVANGSYDAQAQTFTLEVAQTTPPTPGQPVKEPMMIPLAIGLVGADGRDMSLSLEGGRPVVRGVLTLTQAAQTFTFTGRDRAAGAVAQSRLLGADQGHVEHLRRRSQVPRRARQRSVQSLAGGAVARATRCWPTTSRRSAPDARRARTRA